MRRVMLLGDFDEFTKQRVGGVVDRFNQARRDHQRAERLLWLGTMAAGFGDDELAMLEAMGFLSESDRGLLRSAGRDVRSWPYAQLPSTGAEGS